MWQAVRNARGLSRAGMLSALRKTPSLAKLYEQVMAPPSAPPIMVVEPRRSSIMDAVRIKPRPYSGKDSR